MACEATSLRTIMAANATNTIAPAIDSARAGASAPWMPSDPKEKNPNAAKTMQASTALAGFSVLLPATPRVSSTAGAPRRRRSTHGTATTFSAADSPASAYSSGRPRSAAMTIARTEISAD